MLNLFVHNSFMKNYLVYLVIKIKYFKFITIKNLNCFLLIFKIRGGNNFEKIKK